MVVMPLAREILIYIYVSSIVLAGALASKIALRRLSVFDQWVFDPSELTKINLKKYDPRVI